MNERLTFDLQEPVTLNIELMSHPDPTRTYDDPIELNPHEELVHLLEMTLLTQQTILKEIKSLKTDVELLASDLKVKDF